MHFWQYYVIIVNLHKQRVLSFLKQTMFPHFLMTNFHTYTPQMFSILTSKRFCQSNQKLQVVTGQLLKWPAKWNLKKTTHTILNLKMRLLLNWRGEVFWMFSLQNIVTPMLTMDFLWYSVDRSKHDCLGVKLNLCTLIQRVQRAELCSLK